jgi:hypothetical protein
VAASQEDINQRIRWKDRLARFVARPEDEPVAIRSFLGAPMASASEPIRAFGMDGKIYILKGRQAGRQIVNDQIVGCLGGLLGAPVAPVCIADVDEMLTNDPDEPEFAYFQSGLAHASMLIPDCNDDRDIRRYQGQPVNRSRFASLCLLYGWVGANDRQFLYKTQHPNVVYSVDHGHFFPGGPNWTIQGLLEAPEACLDQKILEICQFQELEIQEALMALVKLSDEDILWAVSRPPAEWGITMDERVALVGYLVKRREELLTNAVGSMSKGGQE